jgi:hypothetical protein
MLGNYASTADFSTFIAKRGDGGPRDDVANMRGKQLPSHRKSKKARYWLNR